MNIDYGSRLEKLRRILANEGLDSFVTTSPGIILYFTGYMPAAPNPCVLFTALDDEPVLIAPEGTETKAGKVLGYCSYSVDEYQNTSENARVLLAEALRKSPGKTSVYLKDCAGFVIHEIMRACGSAADITSMIDKIMMVKDETEIHLIRKALELNKAAYDCLRQTVRPGISEMELYNAICGAYNMKAGSSVDFISDLVSGQRSTEVSGPATVKAVEKGDTVIADLLPRYKGYYCDTTRTFFVGSPDDEQVKVYNVLTEALKKGAELLKPGAAAQDIYAGVYRFLEEQGYGSYFPHHAGHGIGTGFYEAPYFIRQCPDRLEPGMVVTIEPGVYLPGKFGIRIENNYLITKDGCINLFDYPVDIDYLVIK